MSQSLYDKYGGFKTINGIVQSFYDKIEATESLDKYFENVDMSALVEHQTRFICTVLGGPEAYKVDLKESHKHLNIIEDDFMTVGGLLQEALTEAGMEQADIEAVMGIVVSTKGDIVTGKAAA